MHLLTHSKFDHSWQTKIQLDYILGTWAHSFLLQTFKPKSWTHWVKYLYVRKALLHVAGTHLKTTPFYEVSRFFGKLFHCLTLEMMQERTNEAKHANALFTRVIKLGLITHLLLWRLHTFFIFFLITVANKIDCSDSSSSELRIFRMINYFLLFFFEIIFTGAIQL